MALITITDVLKDPNGSFPTSGTLTFTLSDWFIDSSGKIIVPKAETAAVSASDGTFSVTLYSTTDATPTTRTYSVSFTGVIEGTTVNTTLGSFSLGATPA